MKKYFATILIVDDDANDQLFMENGFRAGASWVKDLPSRAINQELRPEIIRSAFNF